MHHFAATMITATVVLRQRVRQLRRASDAGLITAEYLMWIAIIAAIITGLGVILGVLFTAKANGLSLN